MTEEMKMPTPETEKIDKLFDHLVGMNPWDVTTPILSYLGSALRNAPEEKVREIAQHFATGLLKCAKAAKAVEEKMKEAQHAHQD